MDFVKIIENAEKILPEIELSPDNLVSAIVKLLEIAHAHGLDEEAMRALSDCGITLEIAEAANGKE